MTNLFARNPAVCVSLGHRYTFGLKVCNETGFQMGRPSIPISIPARLANVELVPGDEFAGINMGPHLEHVAAEITWEH